MKLEEELKMLQFSSIFHKASVNILFTGHWLESKMQQSFKTYGITIPQYNVLRILRGRKGEPMSAFDIQERMIHRTSNVSRILEKLVEKKLVTRLHCNDNRRKIDVYITEAGLSLLQEADKVTVEINEKFSHIMDAKEAHDFNFWLDNLRSNFE